MKLRLLVLSVVLSSVSTVYAEVANTELLGDQANLMGGAVTASTQGGPSLWYNPARLSFGGAETVTFALSGVGFVYRYYNAPNLITTKDGSRPTSTGEVVVLPRATTLVVRAREKLYWGVGLFTPARQDITFQAASSAPASAETEFNAVATRLRRNSLHAVGSVSWNVSERLQLGASVGFVNYSYFHSIQTSSAQHEVDSVAAMAAITQASQQNNVGYGARLTLGISYQPAAHWYLGLSLAPPTWLFFTNIQEVRSQSAGTAEPNDLSFDGAQRKKRGGSWDTPEPGAARLGVAYVSPIALLELDVEASGGASAKDFNVDAQVAGNMRAGALIGLKNKLRVGLGFYTDLEHRNKRLSEFGDSRMRGLGGTCGVNFVSRLPGAPKSGDAKGTYSITLAGRYAYFRGQVMSVDVTDAGYADGLTLAPTRLVVHEAAAQLGLNGAW